MSGVRSRADLPHVVAFLTLPTLKGLEVEGAEQWLALCPIHNDHTPSLAIGIGDDDRILLTCRSRGCSKEQIVQALGTTLAALFARPSDDDPRMPMMITLTELAMAKGLDAGQLRAFGLENGTGRDVGAVLIPHRDMTGEVVAVMKRRALRARDGTSWRKGEHAIPYGLWRLDEWREQGILMICEGHTDTWTAWLYGYPAIGLPGAQTVRHLDAQHVAGFHTLWIARDQDEGAGWTFVRNLHAQLRALGYRGTAQVFTAPERYKDINDLHVADPEHFQVRMAAQFAAAEPLDLTAPMVGADAGRVQLRADVGDLRQAGREAWAALDKANTPPTRFLLAGEPVRLEATPDGGAPRLRDLTPERLRAELVEVIQYMRAEENSRTGLPVLVDARPALDLPGHMLAMTDRPLPVLVRVVEMPVFTCTGRLLDQPGYDAESRCYYAPPSAFVLPPIADYPSPAEIRTARDALLALVETFPFVTPADRAAALAIPFAPLIRDLVDGLLPLVMIDKPKPRTGATLLTRGLLRLALGRPAGSQVLPAREEEIEKTLLAMLRTTPSFVFFDDVTRLNSAALARAITDDVYLGRLLGVSTVLALPVGCLWIATGNNPRMADDLVGRTVPCRLDARCEHPELRTFAEPDEAWLRRIDQERPRLLAAMATLVRAWIVQGRAAGAATGPGGFSAWSRVMSGLFELAEIPGLFDNLATFRVRADETTAADRSLVLAWWARYRTEQVTTARLYEDLWRCAALDVDRPQVDVEAKTDEDRKKRLGRHIARIADQRFELPEPTVVAGGGRVVTHVRVTRHKENRSGVTPWSLEPADDDA